MLFHDMLSEQSACLLASMPMTLRGCGWWKMFGEVALLKCDSCTSESEAACLTCIESSSLPVCSSVRLTALSADETGVAEGGGQCLVIYDSSKSTPARTKVCKPSGDD
jgi:hypothetical protein